MKSLKMVLLVLAIALVLVIMKTIGKKGFTQKAENVVNEAVSNAFMVSQSEFENSKTKYLIVDLDDSDSSQAENSLKIPFKKLLDDSNLQKLKESESNILLVSDDNSVAIKAWVILNQLDLENVFVLLDEKNPEVLKYKFQPDASARLESVSE